MLDKRVQILFDKKDYQLLEKVAGKEAVSVGELVRLSVRKQLAVHREVEKRKRRAVFESVQNWRRKFMTKNRPKITSEEILGWVREGRKYELGG
ncbi:hypothetical protein A3H89_00980 [Candidatus Amesbacteria bacterium RIFCSPLOWO2_02_FULL_48_11]|nr:MAG: hypothetical protein A2V48_04615 [Candidatus Amesbacteria bacterium RBG_19FT_COMBO_48_16]OGC95787.1 MAG: hypothetical protein A3C34_03600 [Candidatus Amesbacteria bacterium RIFCSPHIGHO2_02_FULL_48_21]OGC98756.1 MAG: hypothetical protein A2W16_01905 [Candidatus Amesbacteria bacterium RBG_16_48_31]OGC99238.1 MAG: hypothetical protein A2702_00085 [Candidatus Amesbacteria bacterium RIFCSPHIGHO2_01_FULL_48_75]OGD03131.1 MAG: hypothetical protein A3E17_00965 [Candidatus Amesbacteria bacterium